jgi:hypothetical protein
MWPIFDRWRNLNYLPAALRPRSSLKFKYYSSCFFLFNVQKFPLLLIIVYMRSYLLNLKVFFPIIITLLSTLIIQGCANTALIYRQAIPMEAGSSDAYLSDGFTSEKIKNTFGSPKNPDGDELYFVTYGNTLKRVQYQYQGLLAVYRSAELAKLNGFKCLTIYRENEFASAIQIFGGSNTWSLEGNISEAGAMTGTLTKIGPFNINPHRHFGSPIQRWGYGVYILMSNNCVGMTDGPMVFHLDETSLSNEKDNGELIFISGKIFPTANVLAELSYHLSVYLK